MSRAVTGGADSLVFLPLGGVGEIGMNLGLYGFGPADRRQWLMVDCGVTFANEREPGVDLIYPDISFIQAQREHLLGILLTHAHEDHFGAVMDLWPRLKVPVFATPFTAQLLKVKLIENGRDGDIPIEIWPLGARRQVGPFAIELIGMAHSIPEPNAVMITTPLGNILHSGDWKLDPEPEVGLPTDEARLKALGAAGVDVLICDSTNAMREGISPSEGEVAKTLRTIIAEADARVAVTTFASNVARIRSVTEAAFAAGREVVIAGRALHRMIMVAQETGYLDTRYRYLSEDVFSELPRDKVVVMCTGSQGEPRAAMARVAADEHPRVSLQAGDLAIFSSRTIPGNERAVIDMQNGLADLGVTVITDQDQLVHCSGHPRRGELRQIYAWLKPRALIPVHGEPRHLEEHGKFARACGVPKVTVVRNGDMVRLLPGGPEVIDEVQVGRLHQDGKLIVPEAQSPLRERRKLAETGMVVVSVVLRADGTVATDPEFSMVGIPEKTADGAAMEDLVADAIDDVLENLPKAKRRDPDIVGDAVHRSVRGRLNAVWGKKPVCEVLVSIV